MKEGIWFEPDESKVEADEVQSRIYWGVSGAIALGNIEIRRPFARKAKPGDLLIYKDTFAS